MSSARADSLSATCVGCVLDANINDVAGSKITGEIPAASVPTGSGNYIQNAAAAANRGVQQNADFNITGDGIIGGGLGIGTAPNPGFKLDMIGNTRMTTANGAVITFASPNSESGMSTIFNNGRADLRFDGSTVKLVAGLATGGPPSSFGGISVNTIGNVGVGTTTPNYKFEVNGNALIAPGGSGGAIQFATPIGNRDEHLWPDRQGGCQV